ncbi:MAG: radical SAM protein [Candidatus Hodarchaeota archaeon]
MVDPVKLAHTIESQVCKNELKKYYRFRKTQFYGGCATADCLGCNLRCAYCWAQKKVWRPQKFGKYFTPKTVSEKLLNMNLSLIRISGGEPTIGKTHLLKLLSYIPENVLFILETNGILLNEDYIKELNNFNNLYVRVSLKGVDKMTFEQITGADGKFFHFQLRALELLKKYGIRYGVAILFNIFTKEQIRNLGIPDLEYESLIKYPFIMKNLKKNGITVVRE